MNGKGLVFEKIVSEGFIIILHISQKVKPKPSVATLKTFNTQRKKKNKNRNLEEIHSYNATDKRTHIITMQNAQMNQMH